MGSWLVDELIKRGHQVVSADNLLGGSERNVNRDCKFVKADMRIRDRVKEVVKGIDVIFHLAGQVAMTTSINDPRRDYEINVTGSINVLESVRQHCPAAAIVYSSSNKVYGDLKGKLIGVAAERVMEV